MRLGPPHSFTLGQEQFLKHCAVFETTNGEQHPEPDYNKCNMLSSESSCMFLIWGPWTDFRRSLKQQMVNNIQNPTTIIVICYHQNLHVCS